MPHLPVPGDFQQVEMADEVRGDIGARIVDRIADAGLRAEMDDAVEGQSGQRGVERRMVGEIDMEEAEPVRLRAARPAGPASAAGRNSR